MAANGAQDFPRYDSASQVGQKTLRFHRNVELLAILLNLAICVAIGERHNVLESRPKQLEGEDISFYFPIYESVHKSMGNYKLGVVRDVQYEQLILVQPLDGRVFL